MEEFELLEPEEKDFLRRLAISQSLQKRKIREAGRAEMHDAIVKWLLDQASKQQDDIAEPILILTGKLMAIGPQGVLPDDA